MVIGACSGYNDLVKFLLEECNQSPNTIHEKTKIIQFAVLNGHFKVVRELVNHGVELCNEYLAIEAVKRGYHKTLRELLKSKEISNLLKVKDKDGKDVWWYAEWYGDHKSLEVLRSGSRPTNTHVHF